jgi:hypothetical protein
MAIKLKAWLRKNFFDAGKKGFFVEIESLGSIDPDGIIEALKTDGMELKPETVRDVVTRYNRKCLDLSLRGYNVNTGLVYMKVRARGVTESNAWDPQRNRLHMSISQGTDIEAALAESSVEIMGEHPDPAALYGVTDLTTDKTDGSVTPGFNVELKGTYIKIVGRDEACGLYLRNTDTAEEIKLEPKYITVNGPSRIMFIFPATLSAGIYELRIETQYTSNKTLKHPRTITLGQHLTVG